MMGHTVLPFRVCRAAATHVPESAKRERTEGVEVFLSSLCSSLRSQS
jgi:hypothetical protein